MPAPKFIQAKTTTLQVSITESETTEIKLSKLVDAYGNNLSMTDFGAIGYITIDPQGDNEEIISFTDFTVNSDDTVSIDTGITRGLVAVSPYGAGADASAHASGVRVVVSNNPQMYDAIINYIDGLALAGAPDASETAKGIAEEATQAEVDAKTATGSTGAPLFVRPSKLRTQLYNDYVVDTGVADAYAIAPNPAITAYAAGQEFTFKAQNANTGACTLNVNGLGTKAIRKDKGTVLKAGDIKAGQIVKVVYDGTNMELVGFTSVSVEEFTASDTWNKPAGLKFALVEVWGGGGSGGRDGTSVTYAGVGGGGGGGYRVSMIPASAIGASEAVTVGAGGAGRTTDGNGNDGGDSSFGSLVTAFGGGGGRRLDAARGGGGGGSISAGANTGTGDPAEDSDSPATASDPIKYTTYNGAPGGTANSGSGNAGNGSVSRFGGGGGGSKQTGAGGAVGSGGVSLEAGDGGDGAAGSANAEDGQSPAGGGGASKQGNSGAGGDGKVRVTMYFT